MSRPKPGSKRQPFPKVRPEITIKPSRAKPFVVDLRELPSWWAIPAVGDNGLWCTYEPPDWRLTGVTLTHAVRPARVHGTECVEIDIDGWDPETGWKLDTWMMLARLTEQRSEWLATCRLRDGELYMYTFLDEGFDVDWGSGPRRVADEGRLRPLKKGGHRLRKPKGPLVNDMLGAGVYRVRIGDRAFTCLRVIGLDFPPTERSVLFMSYVTRRGLTVLGRRYNGRLWGHNPDWPYVKQGPWDEHFPDHDRIVINGVTYVHWYDCLGHVSLGIDPAEWS